MHSNTTVPVITMDEVPSSQIFALGYDAASGTLAIRFRDRDSGAPTSLYHYANFTPADYEAFRNAASLGSFFYQHIRPFSHVFPYTCVEKMPAVEPSEPGTGREPEDNADV